MRAFLFQPFIEELSRDEDSELFFLALPHGTAAEYAVPLLEAGKKVIDLSADFSSIPETYEEFYGQPHPAPEWLEKASYGLPELYELSSGNFPPDCFSGLLPDEHLDSSFHSSARKHREEGRNRRQFHERDKRSGKERHRKTPLLREKRKRGSLWLAQAQASLRNRRAAFASFNELFGKVVISFHPHLSPHEQRNMLDCVRSGARRIGQAKGCRLLEPDLRSPPFRQSFARRRISGRRSCGGDQPDRSFGPRRLAYRQVCIVFGRGQPDQRSRRASHSVYECLPRIRGRSRPEMKFLRNGEGLTEPGASSARAYIAASRQKRRKE